MPKAVGRSITRPTSEGTRLGLTNPLDRSYLCGHMCNCNKGSALISKSGQILKQRCVTSRVWVDEEINQLVWQYKAEVGFNMMAMPPAPLMSAKQPNRPSRFPLGKAMSEGIYLRDIEGRAQKGLLRIPDCIVLKTNGPALQAMRASGAINWNLLIPKQSNIDAVIEIKFPGDTLSREQGVAYRQIAGKAKFTLLEYAECDCEKEKEKVKESVRVPVVTPVPFPSVESKRWYQPATSPGMAAAPQPIRPQYGPVHSYNDDHTLANFLKGAVVVAGVIVVGAIVIALIPVEVAAGGVVLMVAGGAATAAEVKKGKKE